MRFTYRLCSVSMLLVFVSTGAANASTMYGAEYPADTSEDSLWGLMTNEGLVGLEPELALSTSVAGRSSAIYTDLALYQAAVGSFESILFTADEGVSSGDMLDDAYYLSDGVLFDINDQVLEAGAFVADDRGVHGHGSIEIQFSGSQAHIGIEFPGSLRIELFNGADLIWTSEGAGDFVGGPTGNFGGVVMSGESFDRAILSDPIDSFAFIDNLHYGTVPEPSTMIVLAMGGLAALGRRALKR